MVSKEIIKTIIDVTVKSYTVKCSNQKIGRNNLSNRVKHGFNEFTEFLLDKDHEFIRYFDSKGNLLKEIEGERDNVNTSLEDRIEMYEYQDGDLISIHNHPTPFIDSDEEYYEFPTLLSETDAKGLFKVEPVGFDEYGDEIPGTLEKSVTCESPNGCRITLTRIDGTSTDNPIVNGSISEMEFLEEYHHLENDWRSFLKSYREEYQKHADEYLDNHLVDFDNPDDATSAYYKEMREFSRDYARNNKTYNSNFDFEVSAFKELGFELTMEWVK